MKRVLIVTALWLSGTAVHAAPNAMTKAAQDFLGTLDKAQVERTVFSFEDAERKNWHFFPKKRPGISIKEMNEAQQKATQKLLKASLSDKGYGKAEGIRNLEWVIREMDKKKGRRFEHRDGDLYHVCIFGKPGGSKPWGWRFEGHHLSLNFSSVDETHTGITPAFFGPNPVTIPDGPKKGFRLMPDEEDLARELFHGLSKANQKKAHVSEKPPREIITKAERDVTLQTAEGVRYADLNEASQKQLMKLVGVYVFNFKGYLADPQMERIKKSGLDEIHFAWAGALEKGKGHYYKVQGPTFLIEYVNTQNNANHAHGVWRDAENDWGVDYLKRHLESDH